MVVGTASKLDGRMDTHPCDRHDGVGVVAQAGADGNLQAESIGLHTPWTDWRMGYGWHHCSIRLSAEVNRLLLGWS